MGTAQARDSLNEEAVQSMAGKGNDGINGHLTFTLGFSFAHVNPRKDGGGGGREKNTSERVSRFKTGTYTGIRTCVINRPSSSIKIKRNAMGASDDG